MPTASHFAPMLAGSTPAASELLPQTPAEVLPAPRLPSAGDALLLADAFSEFIGASAKLELSYRELQREVALLGSELAARNRALTSSLKREEQMRLALAEVVDSMPCGVLVLGAGARLLRMNPEARRILSLVTPAVSPAATPAASPAANSTMTSVATPASKQPATDQPAASSADSERGVAVDLEQLLPRCAAIEGESEFSLSERDGARRWVEVRTRRMTGGFSEVETILILRDVSAHKQAEQHRDRGRRALAQAELATALAHEIRNPLASLELFVGLLEEEPDRSGEWVGHLRAGLRGLSAVVNNMLSFHGAGFLPLGALVMAETIEVAARFAQPIAEQAGIWLSVACEDRQSRVMGNAAALQQIVLNLVANAVRHSPVGSRIAVTLSAAGPNRLLFQVSDTGSGIAAEHLPRIFEPGWSAGGTSTGLGLAVCQRIAAQHGSLLTVRSEPGRGTTFAMEMTTL